MIPSASGYKQRANRSTSACDLKEPWLAESFGLLKCRLKREVPAYVESGGDRYIKIGIPSTNVGVPPTYVK